MTETKEVMPNVPRTCDKRRQSHRSAGNGSEAGSGHEGGGAYRPRARGRLAVSPALDAASVVSPTDEGTARCLGNDRIDDLILNPLWVFYGGGDATLR